MDVAGHGERFEDFIEREHSSTLRAYRERPDNVRENAGQEQAIVQGGYRGKQIQELVQNAVDALDMSGGRIAIRLTRHALYVANEGEPFGVEGIRTLLHSNMSDKRDDKIGRFGLGFKSVLQICDGPQIFTRGGAFGFDAERSRRELAPIHPGLVDYPVLRLPYLLDTRHETETDRELAALLSWATTVVRLPIRIDGREVSRQLSEFRHQFLLFTPQVSSVEVDDDVAGVASRWRASRENLDVGASRVTLQGRETTETWVVVHTAHTPSEAAMADAGTVHARSKINVSWAVRGDRGAHDRTSLGLWNFFPTSTPMTIPGIVNAPFKMNDDRMSVLDDLYNVEILRHALPRLILFAVPHLRTPNDPAAHLSVAPARGREDVPWIGEGVIMPLNEVLASVPYVPDLAGDLRTISELRVRPDVRPDEIEDVDAWLEEAGRLGIADWVHETALQNPFRNSVVERLLSSKGGSRVDHKFWIEGLAASGTDEAHAAAIRFAGYLLDRHSHDFDTLQQVRSAEVVRLASGGIAALSSPLYFPDEGGSTDTGFVSPDLLVKPGVTAALKMFGARTLDGAARVERLLREAVEQPGSPQLADSFWSAAETLDEDEVIRLLTKWDPSRTLAVRTAAGSHRPRGKVWMAGRLLDPDRAGDADLVATRDHPFINARTATLLEIPSSLSPARRTPVAEVDEWWEEVALSAERFATDQFDIGARGKPANVPGGVPATPRLSELSAASDQARAAITATLVDRGLHMEVLQVQISYPGSDGRSVTTQSEMCVPGPDGHWLRAHGATRTSYGLTPLKECVGPIDGVPDDLLPVPTGSQAEPLIRALDLPNSLDTSGWRSVLVAAEEVLDVSKLHRLYGYAAESRSRPPAQLVGRTSDGAQLRPAVDCVVPEDDATAEHLLRTSDLALVSSGRLDLDEALARYWRLGRVGITFVETVRFESAPGRGPTTVAKKFPHFREVVAKSAKFAAWKLEPVRSAQRVRTNDHDDVETVIDRRRLIPDEGLRTFYFDVTLRDRTLLDLILTHMSSTQNTDEVLAEMWSAAEEAAREDYWADLRALTTDQERVIKILGADGLRALVPDPAIELLSEQNLEIDDDRLFRMAQNVHGADLWAAIRSAIPDEQASEWVRAAKQKDLKELGFGEDMFSETIPTKPATEEVIGPVRMPPLHEYQREVVERIAQLLDAPAGGNKGVLQLPTGAGKTRVAVESLIDHARRVPGDHRMIVWIAQSEELCEQAVEAWSSAWPALGEPRQRLVVSRLWGGRKIPESDAWLHVVVATVQTLTGIAAAEKGSPRAVRFEWLRDPAVVVIDEAHGAITSSYTKVLQWFRRSTGQSGKPLLGLSATPYRGTSVEETKRLVSRFDGTLIEPSSHFTAETAHTYLQDMGVLARVDQVELEGSVLKQRFAGRSSTVTGGRESNVMLEDRIDLDSVARDQQRNLRIIEHIEANKGRMQHAIVFAASVEHAQALAAVLDLKGITAAAVHGKTSMSHRRMLVERFRSGDLQVLTNFDVLSQGFDAPKVDTVYLCRPTFSPNKYVQMVGRGLRGPRNGGSETVMIVNIKDHLENFGGRLAYNEFAHLWTPGEVRASD